MEQSMNGLRNSLMRRWRRISDEQREMRCLAIGSHDARGGFLLEQKDGMTDTGVGTVKGVWSLGPDPELQEHSGVMECWCSSQDPLGIATQQEPNPLENSMFSRPVSPPLMIEIGRILCDR